MYSVPAIMSADQQAPTVFVVDDDPAARKSVCALVASMGIHAEGYASGEEFLESYRSDMRGCLVTDLRMLGMSGIQLQEKMQERGISLPVIVITAHADTPVTVQAMRNGAITLLEKPCRDQELWDSIREAIATDSRDREVRRRREEVARRIESLTQQERKVMDQMIAGSPNKNIATSMNVSVRTIESRRHNIFEKTGTESLAELVRLVLEYQQVDTTKRPR